MEKKTEKAEQNKKRIHLERQSLTSPESEIFDLVDTKASVSFDKLPMIL